MLRSNEPSQVARLNELLAPASCSTIFQASCPVHLTLSPPLCVRVRAREQVRRAQLESQRVRGALVAAGPAGMPVPRGPGAMGMGPFSGPMQFYASGPGGMPQARPGAPGMMYPGGWGCTESWGLGGGHAESWGLGGGHAESWCGWGAHVWLWWVHAHVVMVGWGTDLVIVGTRTHARAPPPPPHPTHPPTHTRGHDWGTPYMV